MMFFEQQILENQRRNNMTYVIISHQMSLIKRLCEYTFFMDDGRIREEGETGVLMGNPRTDAFREYLHVAGSV